MRLHCDKFVVFVRTWYFISPMGRRTLACKGASGTPVPKDVNHHPVSFHFPAVIGVVQVE
jgi:hypothetical protein